MNHEPCAEEKSGCFQFQGSLGGSLIRAPDNEEQFSALLLMHADDLVVLTTNELHLDQLSCSLPPHGI